MIVLLTKKIVYKNEKDSLKIKALEWSQHFFHCKSMEIIPDAQGQLTLLSVVVSGQISISSKLLWFSSLPIRMKKIQSKMKAIEWPQENVNRRTDRRTQARCSPCESSAQVSLM